MKKATKGKRQKRSTEKEKKKGRKTSKIDRKGSYCRAINSVPSEMCAFESPHPVGPVLDSRGIGDRVNRWRLRRREGYDKVDDNDRSRELLTKLDGLVTIIPLVYVRSANSKKLVLAW